MIFLKNYIGLFILLGISTLFANELSPDQVVSKGNALFEFLKSGIVTAIVSISILVAGGMLLLGKGGEAKGWLINICIGCAVILSAQGIASFMFK